MRGIGGPLLCIGDLLSDIGEGDHSQSITDLKHESLNSDLNLQPSDLNNLFQEKYEQLNKALAAGTDDSSWTHLMLQLCTSLETANTLVRSTNSSVGLLSDKVDELHKTIINRGSAIAAAAKAVKDDQ